MTEKDSGDQRTFESWKGPLESEISPEHFSEETIENIRLYRFAEEERLKELNRGRSVGEIFLRRLPREEMIALIAEHELTDLLAVKGDINNE